MKTIKTILTATLLLLVVSCSKENTENKTFQINIGDAKAYIETEIGGITYKFQLLNEAGNPATEFNEGENFTFYFSETNNTENNYFSYPNYAYSQTNNFCCVFNKKNENIGRPYVLGTIKLVGIGGYPFNKKSERVFMQNWADNREESWNWNYANYKSNNNLPLKKGTYHTEFIHNFEYNINENKITTGILSFKINFKIK